MVTIIHRLTLYYHNNIDYENCQTSMYFATLIKLISVVDFQDASNHPEAHTRTRIDIYHLFAKSSIISNFQCLDTKCMDRHMYHKRVFLHRFPEFQYQLGCY